MLVVNNNFAYLIVFSVAIEIKYSNFEQTNKIKDKIHTKSISKPLQQIVNNYYTDCGQELMYIEGYQITSNQMYFTYIVAIATYMCQFWTEISCFINFRATR